MNDLEQYHIITVSNNICINTQIISGLKCNYFDINVYKLYQSCDIFNSINQICIILYQSFLFRSDINPLFLEGGGLLVLPAVRKPHFKSNGRYCILYL